MTIKSEICGVVAFTIVAAILIYINWCFGGTFDVVTALIVIVSYAVYEMVRNISIDIEVNKNFE